MASGSPEAALAEVERAARPKNEARKDMGKFVIYYGLLYEIYVKSTNNYKNNNYYTTIWHGNTAKICFLFILKFHDELFRPRTTQSLDVEIKINKLRMPVPYS
jgi:hypothetical protein